MNNPLLYVDPDGRVFQCVTVNDEQFCSEWIDVEAKDPYLWNWGGWTLSSQIRYATRDEAARAAIQSICGESVRQDREFGGEILEANGYYGYSSPRRGTSTALEGEYGTNTAWLGADAAGAMKMLPPPHMRVVGTYHTHGADKYPRSIGENFSDNDLRFSHRVGLPGFVGTPSGRVVAFGAGDPQLRDPYKPDFGRSVGSVSCQ